MLAGSVRATSETNQAILNVGSESGGFTTVTSALFAHRWASFAGTSVTASVRAASANAAVKCGTRATTFRSSPCFASASSTKSLNPPLGEATTCRNAAQDFSVEIGRAHV